MSAIEFSEQDYAAIKKAASAEGMPLDAWVVAHLPLEPTPVPESPAAAPCANGKPARTMADRFAGRVGLIDSGGDGRLSENTGKKFTDYLEEKRRAGTL
jgi:hypothetical protein